MLYLTQRILDAIIFYYLESWTADTSDPSWTRYLTQIELFQRHMTTAAYKIAVRADQPSGSSKSNRQGPVNQTVMQKIAKAFLDGLYALLDGLVLLASDESPIVTGKMLHIETATATGSNPLDQVDLKNSVGFTIFFARLHGLLTVCCRMFECFAAFQISDTCPKWSYPACSPNWKAHWGFRSLRMNKSVPLHRDICMGYFVNINGRN